MHPTQGHAAWLLPICLLCLLTAGDALGQETEEATEQDATSVLAGHSVHGESYNEGPRQAAYLMAGMGNVHFEATTASEQVQRFIDQGVAQLHGFWYYEAERSFRQAAVLDPECAIAYWGTAMANVENLERARDFIKEAVDRKQQASRREQLYIDAFHQYCVEKGDKDKKISQKDRAQRYTRDLETIVEEFPSDIEAKAFLALQLWQNSRAELPIVSHVAIDSVLQDVFDANPEHPAHHYRIHLWDGHKPARALASSAAGGPSLPGIAHMWHMPGHIYSKLHRYQDAVWQQEASARVDHAHMMRDRVLPDQIHNFAHNNEWLIRNLLKVGRVQDALSLAKNMQELPRHPKYNTLRRGSTNYGRERLLLTLSNYQLWPTLIELSETTYFEPTDDPELDSERLRYLGLAYALNGQPEQAAYAREELESLLVTTQQSIQELELEAKQEKEKSKPEAASEPPAVEPNAGDGKVAGNEAAVDPQLAAHEETSTADSQAIVSTQEVPSDPASQAEKDAKCKELADKKLSETESTDGKSADVESAGKVLAGKDLAGKDLDGKDTSGQDIEADPKKAEENRKRREKEGAEKLKKLKSAEKRLEKELATVRTAQLAAEKKWNEALDEWKKSDLKEDLLKAEWLASAGRMDEAKELVEKEISGNPGEVLPVATQVWIQYSTAGAASALESFETLKLLACVADLDTPLLARLQPLASELGADQHWAVEPKLADDIGERPDLDSLGSFRWHPYMAPDFTAETPDGKSIALKQLRGKPTLMIFYLGFGCLHCVEQLHEFSPRAEEFRKSGIDVLAISSEDLASLNNGLKSYSQALDIPLHSDPQLKAFKAYRCFDDFEQQPLHGTFLIDPAGRVLWQDISYEPFMDVDFALSESRRLLSLAGFGELLNQQAVVLEEDAAE